MAMATKGLSQNPTLDLENAKGCGRIILFFILTLGIGLWGATTFDKINPQQIASSYREHFWLLSHASDFIVIPIAAIINIHVGRYVLAPIGAFLFAIIAGTYFVKDVYELPTFRDALNYILASMFTIRYPTLEIEKGSQKIVPGEVNLIDRVGGPGFVIIEPGNAAVFRNLKGLSGVRVSTVYFLSPFEAVAESVNLDDQQGDRNEVDAVTRDGIQVVLRDIHFRYRIRQDQQYGQTVRRSLSDPYPFSEGALKYMVSNLQVTKDGVEKWNAAVERVLVGAITDYVASHKIDDLTAPRTGSANPQLDIKNELFFSKIQNSLVSLGAELLWVDVGHIAIKEETVDVVRTYLWATDWIGDAAVARAYGDARRQAYQELGRAEAQAELILSIADAIEKANPSERTSENIRKILLSRTAQIIDTLTDSRKQR